MKVITAEPPYHAQVWEYPPRVEFQVYNNGFEQKDLPSELSPTCLWYSDSVCFQFYIHTRSGRVIKYLGH